MKDYGIGGMVRTAAWLDDRLGVEVLSIGRSPTGPDDCAAELCRQPIAGPRHHPRRLDLGFRLLAWTKPISPSSLFNVGDGPQGWTDVRRFVQALERSGITSLKQRPVQIGEPGPRQLGHRLRYGPLRCHGTRGYGWR